MKIPVEDLATYLEAWPPGKDWYYDDVENQSAWDEAFGCDPSSYIPVQLGTIVDLRDFEATLCYQGDGPEAPQPRSLVADIKRWLKSRTNTTLVFSVPKGREDAVVAAVKQLGGKQITK